MKLAETLEYDAILLAEAGLVRLGFLPEEAPEGEETVKHFPNVYAHRLPESEFYPAAGQGAIGLEIRNGDEKSLVFATAINHAPTWTKITAEREFLRLLDGGCHTPVGVYSYLDGDEISLFARVFPDEGGTPRDRASQGHRSYCRSS